ncbi:acetylcholine receptor subunit beta-like 1 isoform X2 [Pomacea canaliculata]|uniref:acetylcholine receptor subunit beta-like 1 isoform X2 n=1 Tax=Pomacea canaliculata TaxID=400727 RepID=UPI000D727F21|nr:acetylcholine receptor subunit beta-like 1 isoform X2 [Pomacea canaliculata]
MENRVVRVLLQMLIVQVLITMADVGKDERRLIRDLFENGYNPLIRPVKNVNDSLQVNFSLALSQIISIDEKNQVMKTNVWLQIYWHDYQLSWEASDYGNIDSIRIKSDAVWVPDIVLFNNADGNYEVSYKPNCVIYSSGNITWIPPAIYKSSCSIDVQYFPFDQQICEMKFGSWTFRGNALVYAFRDNMDKLDLNDYLKSGTWDIIDCPGNLTTTSEEFGEEKRMIVFQFILRRKTLFYTVNLIIPCVLISFVSVCVFALPADAGEKITLCISVLLALVVFLLLVSKILPPSLTIPLIAKYLLFTFVMNIVAILATVIIINRNYRTPRTHRMPYWVRVVFLNHLPRYLLMKRPDHDNRWQPKPFTPPPSYHTTPEAHRVNLNIRAPNDLLELTEMHHPHCKLNASSGSSANSGAVTKSVRDSPQTYSPGSAREGALPSTHAHTQAYRRHYGKMRENTESADSEFRMTPEVYKATEAIKFIYQHVKAEEEYSAALDDWKYVARVLDRLLLFIFLGVTFSGTVSVLMNAPHILEYVDQDKIITELLNYIDKQTKQTST